MKASDIIQGLAELINSIKASDTASTGMQQARPQPQEYMQVQIHPDAQPTVTADDDVERFVPPLQAKIELLKKATGVNNVYDTEHQDDELFRIKQMAGIHPVVQDMAGEDEPLDV
jgi:hypothetical protein